MNEPTLYELLGVSSTATPEEIRAAHRRLMRAAHPDAGGTAGLFRTVQAAYETLSDPERRAAYDASLLGQGTRASRQAAPERAPRPEGGFAPSSSARGPSGTSSAYPPGSGRASIYRPMERPPRMPTAEIGAVFDPPLFGDEGSTGARRRRGFGPVGAPWNREDRRAGAASATDLVPMALLRQRVVGVPGAGYAELTRGAELEREAARRTHEVLDAAVLPGYPAMRLVHDLRDPASRASIIDHAVVIGDRVVLLDSVMVTGTQATWDGATLRCGTDSPTLPVFPRLLEQARLWFDPWRVDILVAVHATSGKLAEPEIARVGDPAEQAARVATPLQLVDLMREAAVLEPRTHVVNVRLLRAVLKLRPGALD